MPELSLSVLNFLRMGYGILLFIQLLRLIPHVRPFFLSEKWQGYAQSRPLVDGVQNPLSMFWVMILWIACAVGMILGRHILLCMGINLLFCWYFFIGMRWGGILRGMGAPGFCTYWLGLAVFLLEYTRRYAPPLHSLALLMLQLDFAFIIFSSGYYKFRAGYSKNHGMELGLINPQWAYWNSFYKRLGPGHPLIWLYNQMAWSGQIITAFLMVLPSTRFWGGLLLILSFMVIVVNIRLMVLCQMVMMIGVIYCVQGSWGDLAIQSFLHSSLPSPGGVLEFPGQAVLNKCLRLFLWGYIILLPAAHAGLFYNFYAKKSLPGAWQLCLEKYTNFFGIIIWRVFSPDLIHFYIQIYRLPKGDRKQKILISRWHEHRCLRYRHVAESITVTTLFTSLKYYASNSTFFRERLLRYSASLPNPKQDPILFEYHDLTKVEGQYRDTMAAEYVVDLAKAVVEERVIGNPALVYSKHPASPIHEGQKPGSYLPRHHEVKEKA